MQKVSIAACNKIDIYAAYININKQKLKKAIELTVKTVLL